MNCGAQDNDRMKGWRQDIDAMLTLIKNQHYVYSKEPLPTKLVTAAEVLKKRFLAIVTKECWAS
jgi:hypothetical protein